MTGQKSKSEPHETTYEISKCVIGDGSTDAERLVAWQPIGTIQTTSGAPTAIRKFAESQGEKFTGGVLRAVPTSRITERDVTVETKRQLTLGAP